MGGSSTFFNLKLLGMNQIHYFGTITCAVQRRFVCVCVCVGGGGGAIFGLLFEIWVLIAHRLKSAYMTVYVLVEWMWVCALNSHSMFCI